MPKTLAPIVETCTTCGKTIGNGQTACLWQQEVVCALCHERLCEQFIAMAINPPALRRQAAHNADAGWGAAAIVVAIVIAGSGVLAWLALA